MDTTPKISSERTKIVLIGIGAVIGVSGLWIGSLARRGIGRMAT